MSALGRSRRRTGPATDRGLDFHAGNPLSSVFAHGQEQDLPGSLATHPVTLRRSTTPDDPLRLAVSGASGAAPTRLTMKASSFTDFEAARRFVTCCLRFTTGVTARHARLASGWRAAPLPGGSRTRWIATRGFRSSHPPPQGFPWRNNRSVGPWNQPVRSSVRYVQTKDVCAIRSLTSTVRSDLHGPTEPLHPVPIPRDGDPGRHDDHRGRLHFHCKRAPDASTELPIIAGFPATSPTSPDLRPHSQSPLIDPAGTFRAVLVGCAESRCHPPPGSGPPASKPTAHPGRAPS